LLLLIKRRKRRKKKKKKEERRKTMVKIIIYEMLWTCNDVKNYPNYLWVFGDNCIKKGKKGQSIIRNEPNTIGIPIKKTSDNLISSFYIDYEYENNCKVIRESINDIRMKLITDDYQGIVFPLSGFGNGSSNIKKRAPLTFIFLNNEINLLIDELQTNEFHDSFN
jgi:hypothetical protein